MIQSKKPEVFDPQVPGCVYQLPALDEQTRNKVGRMLDFPNEYTTDEFRQVVRELSERLTEAEAFIRAQSDYMLRMKVLWHRYIPWFQPSKKREVNVAR